MLNEHIENVYFKFFLKTMNAALPLLFVRFKVAKQIAESITSP